MFFVFQLLRWSGFRTSWSTPSSAGTSACSATQSPSRRQFIIGNDKMGQQSAQVPIKSKWIVCFAYHRYLVCCLNGSLAAQLYFEYRYIAIVLICRCTGVGMYECTESQVYKCIGVKLLWGVTVLMFRLLYLLWTALVYSGCIHMILGLNWISVQMRRQIFFKDCLGRGRTWNLIIFHWPLSYCTPCDVEMFRSTY